MKKSHQSYYLPTTVTHRDVNSRGVKKDMQSQECSETKTNTRPWETDKCGMLMSVSMSRYFMTHNNSEQQHIGHCVTVA